MPVATTIKRVGQIDLMASIPAGLYLFVASYGIVVRPPHPSDGLWQQMTNISADLQKQPWSAIFVFFVAFLFGSLIRAIPLSVTEICRKESERFPFDDKLRAFHNQVLSLDASVDPGLLPPSDVRITTLVFNYWKDFVAAHHADAFSLCEAAEARSRFFACMLWAGILGVVLALVALVMESGTLRVAAEQVLLSLLIASCFGLGLRRVREHEALFVFAVYINCRHLPRVPKQSHDAGGEQQVLELSAPHRPPSSS